VTKAEITKFCRTAPGVRRTAELMKLPRDAFTAVLNAKQVRCSNQADTATKHWDELLQLFPSLKWNALERAGIDLTASKKGLTVECCECGATWSGKIKPGERRLQFWWRCPNGCNKTHPALK
jgi:hypothetical protein